MTTNSSVEVTKSSSLGERVGTGSVPQHIAIIMDGNGRWAMQQGLDRTYGHKAGVDTVKRITAECRRLGVKYLTLYTFSTENWNRPAYEIEALMNLLVNAMETNLFTDNNVRLRMVGDFSRLSKPVQDKIRYIEDITKDFDALTVVVAISYSSRWELTNVARQIAQEVKDGTLSVSDISEQTIDQHLATSFMPDPDLLIRTGGEVRVSNYLLWQIAYAELYFCDTFWPDFDEDCLHKAIASYQQRQRRYGLTEAQVEGSDK